LQFGFDPVRRLGGLGHEKINRRQTLAGNDRDIRFDCRPQLLADMSGRL
jgi:hypothetical protein